MASNNGDYIVINTENGNKKKAELVTTFKIDGLGEYVIYKLNKEYYGAKYQVEGNTTKLDTNLNDIEKKALNDVFERLGIK